VTTRAAALVLVAALTACVSGRDCVGAMPAGFRADVMRFVVERGLCARELLPREDFDLALGGEGRPYDSLDDERKRLVALYANGYVRCITDRIER